MNLATTFVLVAFSGPDDDVTIPGLKGPPAAEAPAVTGAPLATDVDPTLPLDPALVPAILHSLSVHASP
jgi:hypothetical protein